MIPGAGGTQRLTHLVGPGRARDLVYTGRQVVADEALAMGLVERVLPPEDVLAAATADAGRSHVVPAWRWPPRRRRSARPRPDPGSGRARPGRASCSAALFGTPDQREGMRAFLEKREPRFGADGS